LPVIQDLGHCGAEQSSGGSGVNNEKDVVNRYRPARGAIFVAGGRSYGRIVVHQKSSSSTRTTPSRSNPMFRVRSLAGRWACVWRQCNLEQPTNQTLTLQSIDPTGEYLTEPIEAAKVSSPIYVATRSVTYSCKTPTQPQYRIVVAER
jgi:hypothetical protein